MAGSEAEHSEGQPPVGGAAQQPAAAAGEGAAAGAPPPVAAAESEGELSDASEDVDGELEEGAEYWFSDEEADDDLEWMLGEGGNEFSDGDWDEDEDGDGLDGWGPGGEFSESSEEPALEEEAVQRVAAETAGRHVCPGWASFAIPTTAHHFQSADALCAVDLPAAAGGGILAATFDPHGVAAWLLPPAAAMQTQGMGQPAAVRLGGFQAPRDIYSMALSPDGRFIATGGEAGVLALYSVHPGAPPRPQALPRQLVLNGLNYFYTPLLLPEQLRELRQAGQPTRGQQQQQQQQQEGEEQQQQQQQQQQQTHGGQGQEGQMAGRGAQLLQRVSQLGGGPGLSEGEVEQMHAYLKAVMGQDLSLAEGGSTAAAGQPQQQAPPLEGPPGDHEGEIVAALHRGLHFPRAGHFLTHAIASQAAAGAAAQGPPAADAQLQDGKGKQSLQQQALPQTEPQPQQRQSPPPPPQQQAPGPAAGVMLRGLVALGLEGVQAQQVPFLPDGMCNGVRWGLVAGQQRLLAADQSGYVYLFELPPVAADIAGSSRSSGAAGDDGDGGSLRPEQLLCAGLGRPSKFWQMRPVNFFGATQHALGARVRQQNSPAAPTPGPATRLQAAGAAASQKAGGTYATAALGPFPHPCNLAAASPDGRWIAVVGDSQSVWLVDQAAGFSRRQLAFELAGGRDFVEEGLDPGAQYVGWNASSSLLAVSSDALHAVFVFEAGSGRMVLAAESHAKPCLCVGFAPWDDRLLVYAEEAKHVHLRRVPQPSAGGDSGCLELNARDDLGDAPPDLQLLRLPVLPAGHSAVPDPIAVDMGNRRRRVTGMAFSGRGGDLLVATKQGAVLRFLSSEGWSQERHATWPVAFGKVVSTLLLCAHRQQQQARHAPGGSGAAGLWALPLPLLHHILTLLAGRRTDWLEQAEPAAQPPAGPAGGAPGGVAP